MVNRFVIATAALVTPLAALSGCSTEDSAGEQTTSATTAVPAGTERLSTQLKTADGTPVANATLDFANGFATVTVETLESGVLSPGFHGLHIHSVGKCEANSVAPTGGDPGNFNSAGGHFQAPGHTGHPASGDLTALEVRSDGSAQLVTTTDAFTSQDLLGGEKTALIIHQDEDNFGHIPDRYSQPNGSPGPDQDSLATGDAGQRVACGVIDSASATSTTTTDHDYDYHHTRDGDRNHRGSSPGYGHGATGDRDDDQQHCHDDDDPTDHDYGRDDDAQPRGLRQDQSTLKPTRRFVVRDEWVSVVVIQKDKGVHQVAVEKVDAACEGRLHRVPELVLRIHQARDVPNFDARLIDPLQRRVQQREQIPAVSIQDIACSVDLRNLRS